MKARSAVVACSLLATCACVTPQATTPAARSAPAPVTRVAIMSAVPAELETLLDATQVERTEVVNGRRHYVGRLAGHPVVLLLSGVSIVNAAMTTQAVIDRFGVGAIVFSGIAGGVNPELAIGDVTVPARWGQYQEMVFARRTDDGWDTDGRAREFDNFDMMFPRGQLLRGGGPGAVPEQRQFWFPVDEGMLAVAERVAGELTLQRCLDSGECLGHQPRLVLGGNGLSGSVFMNNAEYREYLWRVFEADAVDMETAAVAQVAAVNDVPFLAFRSLSDLAGGGPGANEIRVFGELAADNSASVLLRFLQEWRGPNRP